MLTTENVKTMMSLFVIPPLYELSPERFGKMPGNAISLSLSANPRTSYGKLENFF